MLTAAQRKAREHHLTASVAGVVMRGDETELLRLWRELIGQDEPPDFTDNWPVRLGEYLEDFILNWHENKTGQRLVERGRVVEHPSKTYVCATLDAYRAHDDAVLDVKVCNSWQPIEDIIARYTPQCLVQKACRQSARCGLLLMHGTAEPREIEVQGDADYEAEMWNRLAAFWLCVETLTPPVPLPKVVPPEQWRTVDLNEEPKPNWGHVAIPLLQQWHQTKEAADLNAHAAENVKALIPPDVGCVRFSGITIRRDRRGYLSIRQ